MPKPLTFLIVLLSVCFVQTRSEAQESEEQSDSESEEQSEEQAPPVLSPDDERARELFQVGDDLYSQGRYEESLAAFQEAYDLSQRPLLLYNIANAQERAGEWEGAVETLRAYLPHAYDAEKGRIETRIESLQRRVERLRVMREREAAGMRPEPRELGGPFLLATSAALIGGGVALAVLAGSARDELDDACANVDGRRVCMAGVSDEADRDRRMSIGADLLFIAAAGTLALGLWRLLRKDEDDILLEATAVATPNAGSVVVRGHF